MNQQPDNVPRSASSTFSSVWLFFIVVFCWTWFFWIAAAASGTSVQTAAGRALLYLGLLGPTVGGIGFTQLILGRQGWRDYWLRTVDLRRIRATWYLVIFLFVPSLILAAVLLDVASHESDAPPRIMATVRPFLSQPLTILPFVVGVFCYGPLPEELGWRGYALDRLQARWTALHSSLILGAIWAVWHVPLFFIKDTYQSSQGAWSWWFWLFLADVICMAVILTWIFNNTRRSTLAAILFHFVANLTYTLANKTALTNLYATLLWIIAAIAVVALWRAAPNTLHVDLPPID